MEKDRFMEAFQAISGIEDLYSRADDLFQSIPPEIKDVIRNYHTPQGGIEYYLRWGHTAAKEIREDWHNVVSGLECVV